MELIRHKLNGIEIDEPVGFDNFKMTLKRTDHHGMSAEYSKDDLEFYGTASMMIRAAYNTDIDSLISYTIEQKCGNGDWVEIFSGIIDLTTYKELTGDYCSVSCNIGEIGAKTTFNNRIDTTIDISRATSLDGNSVPPITKISVELPSKGVKYTASTKLDDSIDFSVYREDLSKANYYYSYPFGSIALNEFGILNGANYFSLIKDSSDMATDQDDAFIYNNANCIFVAPTTYVEQNSVYSINDLTTTYPAPDVNWIVMVQSEGYYYSWDGTTWTYTGLQELTNEQTTKYQDYHFDILLHFNKHPEDTGVPYPNLRSKIKIYHLNTDGSVKVKLYDSGFTPFLGGDIYYRYNQDVAMTSGEKVAVVITLNNSGGSYIHYYWTIYNDSYVKVTAIGFTESSKHDLILVKDVFEGISKTIGNLEFKSDWFAPLGGGWLKSLVNGYELRKAELPDGTNRNIQLSFKDLIEAMSAIDNIGWGFSEESGVTYLRVEPWKWFYQDHDVLQIENPSKKVRETQSGKIFTRLNVGYSKYLDESEINAIDTFHTEMNYTNGIKAVDNEKQALCKFIADPYAIEVTRRKQFDKNTDSWKYDENVFVICLKKEKKGQVIDGINYFPRYFVDSGMLNSDDTIINPDTMYNIRISPKRNALRWIDRLFEISTPAPTIEFTSGKINTSAKGSTKTEDSYFYLSDSANGNVQTEGGQTARVDSILKAELLSFTFPLRASEYNAIKNDPYGVIQVDGEDYFLDEMNYTFSTGEAEFKLITRND